MYDFLLVRRIKMKSKYTYIVLKEKSKSPNSEKTTSTREVVKNANKNELKEDKLRKENKLREEDKIREVMEQIEAVTGKSVINKMRMRGEYEKRPQRNSAYINYNKEIYSHRHRKEPKNEIKPATGIPNSMLVPARAGDRNVMFDRYGKLVVRKKDR